MEAPTTDERGRAAAAVRDVLGTAVRADVAADPRLQVARLTGCGMSVAPQSSNRDRVCGCAAGFAAAGGTGSPGRDSEPTRTPSRRRLGWARTARATAAVLLGSLAVTAVMLPAAARLPRWIETEIVLGAWWMIVAATLTILLYRGFRLRDDFVYFAPWDRPSEPAAAAPATKDGSSSNLGLDGCSGLDAEGCAAAAVITVALAAAFGVAWVLVEFALPVVFLLMYGLFMRAIGRVANDRHGCEGDLAKTMRWGALWATLYVLPLALITALLHALRR